MTDKKAKCVALYSGGLDSTLAVLLMLQQKIEVTALMFMTHFGCDAGDKSSCSHDSSEIARQFGFEVKLAHLGEKFVQIVKSPKFGHGKNMNPCIDCRILMLREAKQFMEMCKADFLITGEVVGQRPKSQMRTTLRLIEKQAGVDGILVRPLSAKLLPPTYPEKMGWLNRDQLMGINGRSRKAQMELAERFGLTDYPSPAAGCLLTDIRYSVRLKDLLKHQDSVSFNDLNLLRVGRHLRFDHQSKLIVGRNEMENDKIVQYKEKDDILLEAKNSGSPIALIRGNLSEEMIEFAARATARYCDEKYQPNVEITITEPIGERRLQVVPFKDEELKSYLL